MRHLRSSLAWTGRMLLRLPHAAMRIVARPIAATTAAPVSAPARLTPYRNPLPDPVHQTLWSRQLKPGRLVFVGDVHGCPSELQQLLGKLSYDTARDNLLLVGDLVNKGPDSCGVLRLVRQLGAHAVRGNHDDHCLSKWRRWKAGTFELPPANQWLASMQPEEAALLEGLPCSIHLPEWGILVVHAGVVPPGTGQHAQASTQPSAEPRNGNGEAQPQITPPHVNAEAVNDSATGEIQTPQSSGATDEHAALSPTAPAAAAAGAVASAAACSSSLSVDDLLAAQELTDLIHVRNVIPQPAAAGGPGAGHAWHSTPLLSEGVGWATVWGGPQHIFFGHDARRRLQAEAHATGLDTACLYGGSLTAAVVPPLATLIATSPAIAAHAAAAAAGSTPQHNGELMPGVAQQHGEGLPGVTQHKEMSLPGVLRKGVFLPLVTRQDLQVELVSVPAERVHAPVTRGPE